MSEEEHASTTECEAEETQDQKPLKSPRLLGVRHLQAVLLFVGVTSAYAMRVSINIAIVAMVDSSGANPDFPEYPWTESQKGVILSAFFWGYLLTQLPAGPMALRFGAHRMLAISVFGSSVCSVLTPVCARAGDGWQLVTAIKVAQGLFQGVMFPSTHTLLARWVPRHELDTFAAFVYSGGLLGTVLSMSACGVLATTAVGWPSDFWVFGVLGIIWSVIWVAVGAESPSSHKFISVEEREYIEKSLGTDALVVRRQKTPWRAMGKSVPLLAIIVGDCGFSWSYATVLSEMPTYMDSVLGFNLKENGFLSALPYLAMFIMSSVFSSISRLLHNRNILSRTNCRKLMNSIAVWGPGLLLLGVGFANSVPLSVALLTIAVGLSGAFYVGYNINMIDLAPPLAGTLMGISNGISSIISIVTPLVVGAVVTESGNAAQWRIVFSIAAVIGLVFNSFYVIFATAERQPWADQTSITETKDLQDETKTRRETPV